MDKEILSTNKAPAAIGPYSQGIAAGSFVFVSGQLPICAATGEMPEDIKAQAEMSLLNVKAVLEAAGSSLDKVVKTTCFLADINDFAAFNEVYARMTRVQLSSAGAICSMPNRRQTLSALIFSKSSALAFHPASPV